MTLQFLARTSNAAKPEERLVLPQSLTYSRRWKVMKLNATLHAESCRQKDVSACSLVSWLRQPQLDFFNLQRKSGN